MRKLLALALFCLLAAPVMAQETVEEDPLKAKSREELLEDLHKFMKKASDEMDALERELAKASRDAAKADVIAERLKEVRDAMAKGELKELPEGVKEYVKENSEEVSKLVGKSSEELNELAADSEKLKALLKDNGELLKKLAGNDDAFERILQLQAQAERKLEESLNKQGKSAEAAEENLNNALDVGHELKSRSS
ncbi:MAG: hypothetical protein OEY28_13865 [Nitrospira sp.]|nr:hypothetical protein [Nitrospira sp.]